eukprot:scaffold193_cov203-Alexandrium_tamarense.AAC.26
MRLSTRTLAGVLPQPSGGSAWLSCQREDSLFYPPISALSSHNSRFSRCQTAVEKGEINGFFGELPRQTDDNSRQRGE